MARMLGKTHVPMSCPYGCCLNWWGYSKKSTGAKRMREKIFWKRFERAAN